MDKRQKPGPKPRVNPKGMNVVAQAVILEEVCGAPKYRESDGGREGGVCTRAQGWGTGHKGEGRCKDHEGRTEELDIIETNGSSRIVITHDRLNEIFAEEYEHLDELNNLDRELVLVRSMIRLQMEKFGIKTSLDKETEEFIEVPMSLEEVGHQIMQMTQLINQFSASVKRKYEIFALGGQMVPRERVAAYVTQITIVLNNMLRDTCKSCGDVHNQRENTINALKAISSL